MSIWALFFCLCEHTCSWEGHKVRRGLSGWCLLRSWAYKARRAPIRYSVHPLLLGVRARTLRVVCSGQAGDGPSQCYAASMSEELTLTRGVRARTLRMVCSEQAGDGPSHSRMAFVHERCVWLGVRARTLRMVCSGQAGDGPSQGLSCFLPVPIPRKNSKVIKKGLKMPIPHFL